jgi:predicted dehydrogenase
MLKIAIVGCGKIADSHASQIRRIKGAKIVAAFDSEKLMASQFCDRYGVEGSYDDFDELLGTVKPDVVHITTPPQSHYSLAMKCLENGCHVYVEKPFTLYTSEAKELLEKAQSKDLYVTTGHDAQFTHVAERLRKMVTDGYLGGDPVHMESSYCYDLGDAMYAKALLGDKNHWVRNLPGNLLQNVISHGIAKIAEYIESENPEIIVNAHRSPLLKSIGETQVIDELRVIINDNEKRTAYFTFSSQIRPSLNQFRIYGPKNGIFLDETKQILSSLPGNQYKSFGERIIPSLFFSSIFLKNFFTNFLLFLKCDFHFERGKYCLFQKFYQSISSGGPPPIPYREITLTTRIMEAVFKQIIINSQN